MQTDIHNLIRKYDKAGPRYTSYPPATFFSTGITAESFVEQLIVSNQQEPKNISLYFHIPFCPQLCHFCGCNSCRAKNDAEIERYMGLIMKEFEHITRYIDKNRKISQIHWGGGTPNSIPLRFIEQVMNKITSTFGFTDSVEIAMECNPAYLEKEDINAITAFGFNRISLGIQDFDHHVLQNIHRKPSLLPEEELVGELIVRGLKVNFDFVYGLPGQSTQSFMSTIERAVRMKPDRIVTFSYAHVPWIKKAQTVLERHGLPDADNKLNMFMSANELLITEGYLPIGLDHFAKPGDELAVALKKRQLHRNFMGYCSRGTTGQVYAFGASAISQLEGFYCQNSKDIGTYMQSVSDCGLATEKSYMLTATDKICRTVIEEIMCNNYVDLKQVAGDNNLTLAQLSAILGYKPELLNPFIADGLLELQADTLRVLPEGRFFLRNIAMIFDPLLNTKPSNYSATI